jgi:2-methylcitrate dehydratase PrpD
MVKDGSGWGAHAGVSAAWLAREGFTGAPATTIESDGQRALWTDLGSHWRIREQYFKPYPVCRWAQPAIEATLALQRMHRFADRDIAGIAIETFREAVALGADCPVPRTTEDAQYSLPYPVAAALVFGRLGVGEINLPALADGRVQRLLRVMTLSDDRAFSERFPAERWARVEIRLHDGRLLRSEPAQARGDPERPLSDAELREKFFSLAEPVLGPQKAQRIEQAVSALSEGPTLHVLLDALLEPVA